MLIILDSLFHKVVHTTSIPIGVEGGGGGEPWSGGNFRYKNFLWPNGFNSSCFQLYTSQNLATSMPSLTSQSCSDSLLAICLSGKVGAIYRPPEYLWTPDRPVNEASVKADHWSFGNGTSMNCLLVYCCICQMTEKWDLKLCIYKTPFGKSGHIYIYNYMSIYLRSYTVPYLFLYEYLRSCMIPHLYLFQYLAIRFILIHLAIWYHLNETIFIPRPSLIPHQQHYPQCYSQQ